MLRLTRKQVREVDRIAIEEYGLPGIVLMENASRGAADHIVEIAKREGMLQHAVIFCGKGNNGGDGFAIARHLSTRNWDVRVMLCCDRDEITGDALINYRVVERMRLPIEDYNQITHRISLSRAAVVVDAVFGTGFRAPSRLDLRPIEQAARAQSATIVAMDIPSGMDCDTGEVHDGNGIDADYTITFVAEKIGFAVPGAAKHTGEVRVVDIGVPREILDRVKDIA